MGGVRRAADRPCARLVEPAPPSGGRLWCWFGAAFLGYHQPRAALVYSGLADEALGLIPEARADLLQAVQRDDEAHPNPAFEVELADLEAGVATASR